MSSDSPCRILACVSRNQLADCLTWLSNKFNDVIIRFNVCKFDERSNTPQMLIYIEDDLIEDENILSFISCRNYNYLFFCKTSNKQTNSFYCISKISGQITSETSRQSINLFNFFSVNHSFSDKFFRRFQFHKLPVSKSKNHKQR